MGTPYGKVLKARHYDRYRSPYGKSNQKLFMEALRNNENPGM